MIKTVGPKNRYAGTRIAEIKVQTYNPGDMYRRVNNVEYIRLENGTILIPRVHEGEGNYSVSLMIVPRRKR